MKIELPKEIINQLQMSFSDKLIVKSLESLNIIVKNWGLEPIEFLTGGCLSICLLVNYKSKKAVLKCPIGETSECKEYDILKICGEIAPEVYKVDEKSNIFLMEYLENNLKEYRTSEIIEVCNKLNEIDINKIKNLESIEKNIELRIEWAKERFQDNKFIKERENLRKASLEIKKIIKSENRYLNFGDLQDKNIINTNNGLK